MARVYYEEKENNEVVPKNFSDKEALENYYKNLGERIKKARDRIGFTQAKAAKAIGLTPSALANYEAGTRQIPVHILLDLASRLGKPVHYFLGPSVKPSLLIQNALKEAVERFTDAIYISDFMELRNGKLEDIEKPEPMIPLPPGIAKDHHFALRVFNEKTETYDYWICRYYSTIKNYNIQQNDWVIAEKGDSFKYELVQFKNVTPSIIDKDKTYERNVMAIVIAKVERLVKLDD